MSTFPFASSCLRFTRTPQDRRQPSIWIKGKLAALRQLHHLLCSLSFLNIFWFLFLKMFFLNIINVRFGRPGVECYCQHDSGSSVIQLQFLINEVSGITLISPLTSLASLLCFVSYGYLFIAQEYKYIDTCIYLRRDTLFRIHLYLINKCYEVPQRVWKPMYKNACFSWKGMCF